MDDAYTWNAESNPANQIKDLMWFAFMNGSQKPNIPALKSLVHTLIQMTAQKTAGQRDKKNHVPFQRIDTLLMEITIEASCLVLSGVLDDLEGQTTATYKARWEGLKKFLEIEIEENTTPPSPEALTALRAIQNEMKWMEEND